jgi:hypothetical protein
MSYEDDAFVPRSEFDELYRDHQLLRAQHEALSDRLAAIEKALGLHATENSVEIADDLKDTSVALSLPDALDAEVELTGNELEQECSLRIDMQTRHAGVYDAAREKISRYNKLPDPHQGWRADKKNEALFGPAHTTTYREPLGNNGNRDSIMDIAYYPSLNDAGTKFVVSSFSAIHYANNSALRTSFKNGNPNVLETVITTGLDKEMPLDLIDAVFDGKTPQAREILDMLSKPQMPSEEDCYYNPAWDRSSDSSTYKIKVDVDSLEVSFTSSTTLKRKNHDLYGCTNHRIMIYAYDPSQGILSPKSTLQPGFPEHLTVEQFKKTSDILIATIPQKG